MSAKGVYRWPIFNVECEMQATAGLRLLDEDAAENILQAVTMRLIHVFILLTMLSMS